MPKTQIEEKKLEINFLDIVLDCADLEFIANKKTEGNAKKVEGHSRKNASLIQGGCVYWSERSKNSIGGLI